MIELLRKHDPASAAIIDASKAETVSYGELCDRVEKLTSYFKNFPGRPLIFLYGNSSADSVIAYLACLCAHVPVCLFEANKSTPDKTLIQTYGRPHLLLAKGMSAPEDYAGVESLPGISFSLAKANQEGTFFPKIHPKLALLLQTSGSTGNPKLVRLSLKNISENARSIIQYLRITPEHRAIQSLPINYSYGLSVLNSHLIAGAAIVISAHSFLRPEFWEDFDRHACTSFAGVPFMYETLDKLRFEPAQHPSLRSMTQAGGALRADLIQAFSKKTQAAGVRFYVMYGQTEATARIAYVPPEKLDQKIGSIGLAIPGGKLELADVEGMKDCRELIYSGPNVMMGYAENEQSLSLGDELHGRLATGDLGRVDGDGYFYVEGRLKRFAKIYGLRIQLEDVERKLEEAFPARAAALDAEGSVAIFLESEKEIEPVRVKSFLAEWLQLPPKAFFIQQIPSLPMNASGKKDYKALVSS